MAIPLISTSRITITLNINVNDDSSGHEKKKKTCGFHLTRSKWDPYPWIGYVEHGSIADIAGLKTGDCLLQIDQVDIVGFRVKDIAALIKNQSGDDETRINLQIWRSEDEENNTGTKVNGCKEGAVALSGPLSILIRKFIKAISTVVSRLECPVCLETATSPVSQCVHGHILCAPCRTKTLRCPVCRVRLGQGRCLIADEIQQNIKQAFDDGEIAVNANIKSNNHNNSLKEKLFGKISLKSLDDDDDDDDIQSRISVFEKTLQLNKHIKKYKTSFSRLLRGGFDRAISADNLVTDFENLTKHEKYKNHNDTATLNATCKRLGELTRADRTKSASTGELCENNKSIMMNVDNAMSKLTSSKAGHYLGIPMTPSSWGGSMESMSNNNLFLCPLFMQSNCQEPLTQDRLAEHFGYVHNYKNQMHFYGSNATISISSSSSSSLCQSHLIYIFHYADQLFIFQYENEAAWMIGTGVNSMKWIMHAWTHNKTQLKLQRQVLRINDAIRHQFSSQQAQLPNHLSIDFIHIEITSLPSDVLL